MFQFDPDPSDALALLSRCPVYEPTPMRSTPDAAKALGCADVLLKDETARMGLGSFKALGGVYAVADLVRSRRGSVAAGETATDGLTVTCASAGNHGLSVAAGAALFGAKAVIVLADTVPESFAERLRSKGADVLRHGAAYEDAMACSVDLAKQDGWELVSDTSWEGYTAAPSTIMRGYCVMAQEMSDTFRSKGEWPTHVALQAGVGGLAAAVAAHIRSSWDVQPKIIVVEPERAACLKSSVETGRMTRAPGPVSNMGRLDCKDASLIAFEVLRDAADAFVTISDEEAAKMTTRLEGWGTHSTPSGAAGLAGLTHAGLGTRSRALAIVSEGSS